ncbi:aspartyl protease family protein [Polaribacter sp. MSW13]|uniref:Aspartyl protease family protein n=1 Tax=Polaribacter marinus TaxID=2916838 RepID=A0A9X1VKS1_9FLAO|nr:aspartyl protease family protein [Polaribacter marinus]MCI2227840.1 aspartyl protease family protein [Polaribacter marinus]
MNSQLGFHFKKSAVIKQKIDFKLINNLIVIPIEINGKELSFILDTGVNKTILFSLSKNDSVGLKDVKKVKLQGLGKGNPVDALLSKNNNLRINNIFSTNETVYVILRDYFDLSSKMGTTIHGIIGYNLLKNLILKINYNSKKITFYNPKKFNYKNCRKCEIFPLEFYRKKPYIDVQVQLDTVGNTVTDVKMLIDSGGSDAIWLFEGTKETIQTPILFFNDILGEGLSGFIYGNRSRIPKMKIGSFVIEKPTVSFLDSLSTRNARNFSKRNGSIGGNILKRFKVWIDYPNKKITLKKSASLKGGFNYNMSGLDVVYNGNKLVKIKDDTKIISYSKGDFTSTSSKTISFTTNYSFKFLPSYKVDKVINGSVADIAGIKSGDIILKINGTSAHDLKLNDIIHKFQEKDGKKIKIEIKRGREVLKFNFRLKKRI